MFSGQRPAGEVMIEIFFQDLVPTGGVVTGNAVAAELTEVDVILCMAANTVRIHRFH